MLCLQSLSATELSHRLNLFENAVGFGRLSMRHSGGPEAFRGFLSCTLRCAQPRRTRRLIARFANFEKSGILRNHWVLNSPIKTRLGAGLQTADYSTQGAAVDPDRHATENYPYRDRPLSSKDSIRLLVLKGGSWDDPIDVSLRIGDVQEDAFETLSYTWNDPYAKALLDANAPSYHSKDSSLLCTISCDGYKIGIKPNLFLALRRLRRESESRIMWIDALCLNQKDNEEKSERVPQMRQIYANARHVIIWLGEEDCWTQSSMETISRWAKISQSMEEVYQPDYLKALKETKKRTYEEEQLCFEALIRRSWFTRAWTFQELVLAQKVELRCGGHWLPWDVFRDACATVIGAGQTHFVFEENSNIQTLYDFSNRHRKMASLEGRTEDESFQLSRLLQRTRLQHASDPRDKLYSLLGIANSSSKDVDAYKADYDRPVWDVYCHFTRAMIKEDGDLGILSAIQTPSFEYDSNGKLWSKYSDAVKDLPTWVPAFHHQDKIEYVITDSNVRNDPPRNLSRTRFPQPIAQQYNRGWPRYWLNRKYSYRIQSGDITFKTATPEQLGVYGVRVGKVNSIFPIWFVNDPSVRVPAPSDSDIEENLLSKYDDQIKNSSGLRERARMRMGDHSGPIGEQLQKYFQAQLDDLLQLVREENSQGDTYRATGEHIRIALLRTLTADMLPISPRLPEFYKKTYFPFHYDWHFWNSGFPPFSDKEMIGFSIRGVKTLFKFVVGTIKVQMNLRRRGSGQSWHAFDTDELHSPDRIRKLYDRLLLGDTSKQRRPWHVRLRAFFMRWSLVLAAAFAAHNHFHPSLLSLWLFYFASIAGLKLVYCAALAVRSINARPSERDPSIPAAWKPMALEAGRNELWGLACEIQNAVDRASWNRLLFVTDNGYIGIGPLNTEPGDEVFSLVGGHVPHVLKRRSEGEQVFVFKGESYVHGIMDGELWPDPEVWRDLEKMKKQAVRIVLI